ncbi:LOW QUALITY PROTEIN: hypothetical protein SORBI_3002G360000 [Sorghum bicolor]|uniref:Uncharacterized protein n=1 Tax=Sorghum bicolor TaxID=4558 RepID=A0A1W0W759_SORBI|nr:LOW QUALITY PROTEIN: hypothetical protein SORBI_3002G360000 [Sorghum bicolor]
MTERDHHIISPFYSSMIKPNKPKRRPQHYENLTISSPHSFSLDQEKNPTMADAAAAQSRADAEADGHGPTSDSADDFEFCILSSGGIVPAGKGAGTDMCVADEVFCQGKLLPLRPSSAAAGDGASVATTLPRSESAASTVGLVSRRSASSSGSSSGCVSRSQSSKSASSDQGAAIVPPRRSLSSSVFYAHPSPSPQLRRSARPRRSTGSAAQPAAAWGLFRLGVVGVPDVYPPPSRSAADAKIAAAAARGGGSRSARFEQVATAVDRKLGLAALFGDGLGCKCSPDAIEPVRTLEAAKRGRKNDGAKSGGQRVARRSRILDWLEELSIVKEKK